MVLRRVKGAGAWAGPRGQPGRGKVRFSWRPGPPAEPASGQRLLRPLVSGWGRRPRAAAGPAGGESQARAGKCAGRCLVFRLLRELKLN